jgi:hypothetical protein
MRGYDLFRALKQAVSSEDDRPTLTEEQQYNLAKGIKEYMASRAKPQTSEEAVQGSPQKDPAPQQSVPLGKIDKISVREGTPYDQINDQAMRMHIQEWLESKNDPNAVSPAGARGLWQIMPGTQTDLEDRGYIERGLDPFNPEHSRIMRDAKINSLLKLRYISNPPQEIPEANRLARIYSGYNWGEGATERMLNEANAAGIDIYGDPRLWFHLLPKETRDYLNQVLYGTPDYE